jgi:hypothetical protein
VGEHQVCCALISALVALFCRAPMAHHGGMTGFDGLQGYTNYQLDPKAGTYTKVGDNGAPPFMGVDPNGKPYTSYAARAPAPGPAVARISASQAAAEQQVRPLTYQLHACAHAHHETLPSQQHHQTMWQPFLTYGWQARWLCMEPKRHV